MYVGPPEASTTSPVLQLLLCVDLKNGLMIESGMIRLFQNLLNSQNGTLLVFEVFFFMKLKFYTGPLMCVPYRLIQ